MIKTYLFEAHIGRLGRKHEVKLDMPDGLPESEKHRLVQNELEEWWARQKVRLSYTEAMFEGAAQPWMPQLREKERLEAWNQSALAWNKSEVAT